MALNPQEHLDVAASLLQDADDAYDTNAYEREQTTILLLRAQTHVALAKAQRYLALSQ